MQTSHIKILSTVLLLVLFTMPLHAAKVLVIDNFEDGNLTEKPKWFAVGNAKAAVQKTDKTEFKYLGDYALRLQGETDMYFIGGIGAFLGFDATPYNFIKMLIRGRGSKTGTLQIELFDDDNNNRILERHPVVPSETAYDDKFIYSFDIDWSGWKVVIIPIKHFRDDNPNIGDNIFNPNTRNGSGGLLQMQILAFSAEEKGSIDIQIDSIKMYR